MKTVTLLCRSALYQLQNPESNFHTCSFGKQKSDCSTVAPRGSVN